MNIRKVCRPLESVTAFVWEQIFRMCEYFMSVQYKYLYLGPWQDKGGWGDNCFSLKNDRAWSA